MKKTTVGLVALLALFGGCRAFSYVPEQKENDMNPTTKVYLEQRLFPLNIIMDEIELWEYKQNDAQIGYAVENKLDTTTDGKIMPYLFIVQHSPHPVNCIEYVKVLPQGDLRTQGIIENFNALYRDADSVFRKYKEEKKEARRND